MRSWTIPPEPTQSPNLGLDLPSLPWSQPVNLLGRSPAGKLDGGHYRSRLTDNAKQCSLHGAGWDVAQKNNNHGRNQTRGR
jgi:hypothetical protein